MARHFLSEQLIQRCSDRAGAYDRDNRFFHEDLADLREAGYLLAQVPRDFGGLGLPFNQVCKEQRSLARQSAPTALAINMHIGATGVAADLYRKGDQSQAWILEEARQGAIFAYGYSDSSNDLDVLYATTKAERVNGGYRFHGHRHFGSLSPVWNWLHTYGVDTSDPDDPKMVFGVIARDAPGYRIVENWDTLGMRATQSHDTILEGVYVPDKHIFRIAKPGFAGADQFLLTVFGQFEPLFANIYVGLAERALSLTLDRVQKKTSVAMGGRSMAHHPEVQHSIAGMVMELDAITAHVDRIADDWTLDYEHGDLWPSKLVSAKYRCVEGAFKIVDTAMDVSGGRGMFRGDELERIYRDTRCGRFHPANSMVVHEVVGKSALGILGETGPRWG
jgi:alkylation response protein AidB-like acyl-CoA dehydrogenase